MPVTDYKTLYGRTKTDLDAQIAAHLANSYQPHGELKIITEAVSGSLAEGFYQAMTQGTPTGSLDDLISRLEDVETLIDAIPTTNPANNETIWNHNGVLKLGIMVDV